MAFQYSNNDATINTGAKAIWAWIATLKAAGWTQADSSDGTTRAAGQVTGGGTSTNGLGNSNAWVRLQMPTQNGVVREITIQRGTTDLVWRLKYSFAAGFTGGSPSASVTPSATDERILHGSGTDASPTFATLMPTNATYRFAAYAGDSS